MLNMRRRMWEKVESLGPFLVGVAVASIVVYWICASHPNSSKNVAYVILACSALVAWFCASPDLQTDFKEFGRLLRCQQFGHVWMVVCADDVARREIKNTIGMAACAS